MFSPDHLVSSADYGEVMESRVLPELSRREVRCPVTTPDGTVLFCVAYPADAPRGTVLLLHGFTENAFKYAELAFSLVENGFSVLAYDQRGHGRSGRAEGLQDISVTHVDRFQDYVDDLTLVCSQVLASMPAPHLVFAHSMGGAVTALFLESCPDVFAAAALSSPMIAPNTGVPAFAASAVCTAAVWMGRGKHYPFFMKPWSGPEDFATSCATDPSRFAWFDAVKTARPEFHNSVPSYQWTLESMRVTQRLLAPGAPERIACPVLLSSAETDSSVLPAPQKAFISRVPQGRFLFVPGSRHEIYRSANDVLFPWWHEVLSFLNSASER